MTGNQTIEEPLLCIAGFLNWDVDFFTDFTTTLPNLLEPAGLCRNQINIINAENIDS
jgi:hypothetical protein